MDENNSEIARILRTIEQEYRSAKLGVNGLAEVARHAFITARMERMRSLHSELQEVVGGAQETMKLIVETIERL